MTRNLAHLIVALLAFSASWNYLPSKICLEVLSPESLVAMRFGIGALATFLLFPRVTLNLSARSFFCGALTGCFFGVALISLFYSLRVTHSGITAFLVGLCAVFAPLFEYLTMRRLPTRYQLLGLTIALLGSAFLAIRDDFSIDSGSLWGLLSAVIFGAWSVAISYFRRTVPALELGLGQIYGTALLFACIAIWTGGANIDELTPNMWLGLVYLGVVGVSLRFLLQTYVQGFTTATSVEIIFMLEPIFAFVWATYLHDEVATRAQICGCLLILVGVLAAQKEQKKAPSNFSA